MDFWISIGSAVVAAGLAAWIVPGRTPGGVVGIVALGVLASIVGGFANILLFGAGPSSQASAFTFTLGSALFILYGLRVMMNRPRAENQ